MFLIVAETSCGIEGYGEIISFFNPDIIKVCLERMIKEVEKSNFYEISKLYQRAVYDASWMRTGRLNDLGAACWAGIETALYSAYSKKLKIPITDFFGGILNHNFSLAVNLDYNKMKSIQLKTKTFMRKGYKNFFLKVAKNTTNLDQDIEFIETVSKASKNSGILIDANGAWTLSTALKAIELLKIKKINIKCIEQPVMEPKFLKRIKKMSNFSIGVNEILNSSQSIIECAKNNIADIFVLDIFECGGLRNMFFICKFLESSGYQVICRAHGNPGISYLTSVGILSCTNAASISTPMQIYDYSDEFSFIKWKPKITKGMITIDNNDLDFQLDFPKVEKFTRYYSQGKKYFIYSNKKSTSKPMFPKY